MSGAQTAMKELMKSADKDGSGKIKADELYPLIAGLADKLHESQPTRKEVEEQLEEYDTDLNGELDLEEFSHLYTEIVCKLYFMPRSTIQLAAEDTNIVDIGKNGKKEKKEKKD